MITNYLVARGGNMSEGMTYSGTGVDYGAMDPFKIAALAGARPTAKNLERFGFKELEESRGESAYIIYRDNLYLAFTEEGLGTKNVVADAMYSLTGKTYYDSVAQCTLAMIINDLITVGALPLNVMMHLAVGVSKWFDDEKRYNDLINGWANACFLAGSAWGGGETPTLRDIVFPESSVLSGSGTGIIREEKYIQLGSKIMPGDVIILLKSSGIHANGITLLRDIAKLLKNGYLTDIPETNMSFGKAILQPTIIYASLIEECQNTGIDIHYAVNITGHGWRKLMRATPKFSYVVERIPENTPFFRFVQKEGSVSNKEAYGNLNMGAGFALYVPPASVKNLVSLAERLGYSPIVAGYVETAKERSVHILPKDIHFNETDLKVR